MRLNKFISIAFIAAIVTLSQSFQFKLLRLSLISSVVAGTKDNTASKISNAVRISQTQSNSAKAYVERGNNQIEQRDYLKAVESFNQAIKIDSNYADAYLSRGIAYEKLGKSKLAIQDYSQAISININLATAYYKRGYLYIDLGQFKKAITDFDKYIQIKPKNADGYNERGYAKLQLGNNREAIKDFDIAIRIKLTFDTAYNNRGIAYRRLGNHEKAIEDYSQSIKLDPEDFTAYLNRAKVYLDIENTKAAYEDFNRVVSIALKKKENQEKIVSYLIQFADTFNEKGKHLEALNFYQQGLKICDQLNGCTEQSYILNMIGFMHSKLDNYSTALEYYNKAIALARKLDNKLYEHEALSNIAIVYAAVGNYVKSLELQQQSLKIADSIKNIDSKQTAYNRIILLKNISINYIHLNNHSNASKYNNLALKMDSKLNNNCLTAELYVNAGLIDAINKEYSQAIEHFRKASILCEKLYCSPAIFANSIQNSGIIYLNLKQYQQALQYFRQYQKNVNKNGYLPFEAESLHDIGNVFKELGQYEEALTYYNKSLTLLQKTNKPSRKASITTSKAEVYVNMNRYLIAEKNLFNAINILESLRPGLTDENKISIFERQTDSYQLLQKVLVTQNKNDKALEISERGRSRAFVELLAKRLTSNNNPIEIKAPKINELTKIAASQNATLVEYSIINDEDLYIWVVQPQSKIEFRSVNLKSWLKKHNISLKELVNDTRKSIGAYRGIISKEVVNPSVDRNAQTLRLQQLHQLLIEPIANLLPNNSNERVIFVPQGELFLVPFAALQDKNAKYLIEKHTILTAPAIQILQLTRQQQKRVKTSNVKNALVLGNPTMPSVPPKIGDKPQKLPPLPGTQQEAESIAPLLNTKALTGNKATKAAVLTQISKARIIHLATHGFFDDFQGLESAIALAPTSNDSGLLTAREILELNLNAELVVLSACNTGRGKITGDGVIGLSRSLIAAGTPSVVVSLWSVPDAPTAELMQEFYINMYQKRLNKAQSLRQAMLKIMENNRDNPRAWAAFTLVGEAD